VEVPDVSYARSGDVAIAYQVVGEGPDDLAFLSFFANLYTLWKSPPFAEFCRRLATGRRVILINPRGVGLSDRPRGFTIESRVDDVRAVMDELGIERAPLLGVGESAATCAVFAATYPDRVERLLLYLPSKRVDPQEREQLLAQLRELREQWGKRDFLERFAARLNPQWRDDPDYVEWFVWHHRLTASPSAWGEFRRMTIDLDLTDVLPAIRIPTLVLTKDPYREEGAEVAATIGGAELVVLPGRGVAIHENHFSVEAIEVFLAGAPQRAIPDTVLATVLFTDLVESTARAAAVGDRAWGDLLDRHNALVRRELERFRGLELDTAGDGFFAQFGGPARAIGCARAIIDSVAGLGLAVRAGIHTGECERVGEKLAGLAVTVGARVSAAAGPGEVLVSQTVKDLVAGSGISFADRGVHELKGIPGEWRIYSVVDD
jgi:class 3 adenylate cyclase/pimeloyl-ACP methyl ester carboxylesterase